MWPMRVSSIRHRLRSQSGKRTPLCRRREDLPGRQDQTGTTQGVTNMDPAMHKEPAADHDGLSAFEKHPAVRDCLPLFLATSRSLASKETIAQPKERLGKFQKSTDFHKEPAAGRYDLSASENHPAIRECLKLPRVSQQPILQRWSNTARTSSTTSIPAPPQWFRTLSYKLGSKTW
jgi:hypothetical protein